MLDRPSPAPMTAMEAACRPVEEELIDISLNFENDWTPEHYLKVLRLRLPLAIGCEEYWKIQTRIENVDLLFVGRAADDPAWLEFREWFVV